MVLRNSDGVAVRPAIHSGALKECNARKVFSLQSEMSPQRLEMPAQIPAADSLLRFRNHPKNGNFQTEIGGNFTPNSLATLDRTEWQICSEIRNSRIRLSDKASCVRPRKVACRPRQPNETQGIVDIFIRETCISPSMSLVFGLQPLAEPKPGVSIHTSVGFTDRSQTEVSGPPHELAVEVGDQVVR